MENVPMKEVRIGIIGAGGMANTHLHYLNNVSGAAVTAIADVNKKAADRLAQEHSLKSFEKGEDLLDSGLADAVIITTPHYFHTTYAIEAFKRNIHVLTEKPVAVHAEDAARMNTAYSKTSGLVYSVMFQARANPVFKEIKEMMEQNALGRLIRITWINASWFRSQGYYDSGGWRATWKGEGGGVIINQCPHTLDLFQWFVGMPVTVFAKAYLGKWHDIEVDDDITVLMELESGVPAVFLTNTIESNNTNRIEISGENGTLLYENKKLTFSKYAESLTEYVKNTDNMYEGPKAEVEEVPVDDPGGGHQTITQNFVNAILEGKDLIAPGVEGYNSVAIGNAMLWSGLTGKQVAFPLDEKGYTKFLQERIDKSEKS